MTGREEKENSIEVRNTYPWPQPLTHHHHYPHQNQKPVSS